MQLTFHDIEKAFEIREKTLYQWLNDEGMPAVKANDQYYFNSAEVLEWALRHKVRLTPGALELCAKGSLSRNIFSPALTRGGIYFNIKGNSCESVLGGALDLLPLPQHIERPFLKEMLVSCAQTGTTGIGNGIAIPHVKHPVILSGLEPMVGLFFLEDKIDLAASDGQSIHMIFVILSGSFKEHLSLLSRLAFCLQDTSVKTVLDRKQNSEEIIAAFHVAESRTVRAS